MIPLPTSDNVTLVGQGTQSLLMAADPSPGSGPLIQLVHDGESPAH